MRLLFFASIAAGAGYFGLKRRRFDLFALAYTASLAYFLPGILGFVNVPLGSRSMVKMPLVPEAYAVMALVVVSITLGAVLFDAGGRIRPLRSRFVGSSYSLYVVAATGVAGLLLTMLGAGNLLLSPNKAALAEHLGRWYIMWEVGSALGAVMAFSMRRWRVFWLSVALLAGDLFLGFRSGPAVAAMAIGTLWLAEKGRMRLLARPRVVLAGLSGGFFFVYKGIYAPIKAGAWNVVIERTSNPSYYVETLSRSEPFTTQMVLNETLLHHFHVGMEHFTSILAQILLFAPSLGLHFITFGEQFKSAFFPGLSYGLASNTWAEMWSSGGWLLLVTFLFAFVGVLGAASYLLEAEDRAVRSTIALMGSFWAFYLHRTGLAYQLNIQKRILILAGLALLLAMIAGFAGRSKRQLDERNNASGKRWNPR